MLARRALLEPSCERSRRLGERVRLERTLEGEPITLLVQGEGGRR